MASTVKQSTGRRKRAVARVRLVPGNGTVVVNGHELAKYVPSMSLRAFATEPLRTADVEQVYDVFANIDGGGSSGQAGALRMALARAIIALQPDLRPVLKGAGMLTRDAREKESKKYGLKKARKAPQYSKR